MKLTAALARVTRLGVDTAPFIYFIEAHPHYNRLVTELFARIDRGEFQAVTSVVTLGEVLVQPFLRGDTRLQREYRDLLLHSRYLWTRPITPPIAERAAELRARYRFRMPDALQLANALDARCQAFVTNDAGLRRVADLRVLVLDELEP